MLKIKVRQANLADAESIQKLCQLELGYDYPLEAMRRNLNNILDASGEKVLVATVEGQAVGFVHGSHYQLLYADNHLNILGIAVKTTYQKQGIGKALMGGLEDWAQAEGVAGVKLNSGSARQGAHDFYQHLGYEDTKEQKVFIKRF